jgi:iduronate 2-sulfatase
MLFRLLPGLAATVFGMLLWPAAVPAAGKPNVLLILIDDLKPALGCYGDAVAHSPHIDRLAQRGMRFDLAYCNQAVCAPSRFNLMLGAHSTSTGLYGLGNRLRDVLPDAVTLPQHFARHGGYRTESLGKVFHIGHGNQGDPESFQTPHFHEKVIEYLLPESTGGGMLTREEALFTNQKLGEIRSLPRGAAFESPDVEDTAYADGRVAEEAVRRLRAAHARRVQDGAFVSVFGQRGASPLQGDALRPVSESNCVLVTRGGKQLEENDQSVTKVNRAPTAGWSRPGCLASLPSCGEAQTDNVGSPRR